jgi:transcriptional regulator with XRE-family HTH domain
MEDNLVGMRDSEADFQSQATITGQIKSLMKGRKILSKTIAAKLGYSESGFSLIMNNKHGLSVGMLMKIADLLGVGVEALLPIEKRPPEPATIDEQIERKVLEILAKAKK